MLLWYNEKANTRNNEKGGTSGEKTLLFLILLLSALVLIVACDRVPISPDPGSTAAPGTEAIVSTPKPTPAIDSAVEFLNKAYVISRESGAVSNPETGLPESGQYYVGGTITENPSFIGNFPHPHIGVGSLWHLESGTNGAMTLRWWTCLKRYAKMRQIEMHPKSGVPPFECTPLYGVYQKRRL